MNVVCPRCETTFAFPDEMYRPGRKVRCSVCQNVFPLPEKDETAEGAVEQPQAAVKKSKLARLFRLRLPSIKVSGAGRSKKLLVMGATLICLVFIGFAGYMAYRALVSPADLEQTAAGKELSPEEQAVLLKQYEKIKNIQLSDVRQYLVRNEKLRRDIMVIEGFAGNGFDTTKEFLVVEAVLYDEKGKALVSKAQVAGPTLSILQLQNFGEKDLDAVLNDKVAILTTNTDVGPGKKVPFVIVFTRVPTDVAEFVVRPIGASDPNETAQYPPAASTAAPSPNP